MYVITRWGDGEWGVVVGFLDRIAQPNQLLESGMGGASQVVKWSQCVSRLKTVLNRNSMNTHKCLFNRN